MFQKGENLQREMSFFSASKVKSKIHTSPFVEVLLPGRVSWPLYGGGDVEEVDDAEHGPVGPCDGGACTVNSRLSS